MAITLRELATGNAVGEGFKARRVFTHSGGLGGWYEVDSFSVGTCKVYARPAGHTPPAPVSEFDPGQLGLYIGHEHGQPISSIKWGGQAPIGEQFVNIREIVQRWHTRSTLRPGAEDIEAEAARAMREIAGILGV